ncbi:MAG: RIP metalloprotease RseP [Dehalococcoidia bacterium]|nr:RIP metalloprotease RseP [Dehalococcoidia bacterium]HCU99828.1 RIP metalloprotease RseP [Dehalococcoidia bacterium]
MTFLAAFDLVDVLRSALIFLALLVPLVVIHELGHFIVAKAFGIKVLEFGIGFPPRVKGLACRIGETEYTINWLPIGGFVRMLGEEDPSDPRSLAAAAHWKRFTVMGAGVVMNLGLALLLFSIAFMVPRERALNLAQVSEVMPDSPAAMAVITGFERDGSRPDQGLQAGDVVMEVNGREVRNVSELIFHTRRFIGETQTWVISRGNSTLGAELYARWRPPEGQGPTGIRVGAPTVCSDLDSAGNPIGCRQQFPFSETVSYPPWEAIPRGWQSMVDAVIVTKNEIQVRVNGSSGANPDQPLLSGPVGIASTTGDIVEDAGWRPLIELAALLSLSLAVFNALPIPALDGGRMFFVLVELLRGGRRISPEKESLVHLVGFAMLLSGILVITFFDISRLIT